MDLEKLIDEVVDRYDGNGMRLPVDRADLRAFAAMVSGLTVPVGALCASAQRLHEAVDVLYTPNAAPDLVRTAADRLSEAALKLRNRTLPERRRRD